MRNRALLVVLYRAGLRISAALALKPKDVDAVAGTITVLHGKGDRRRTIGLDDGAFDVVAGWLERRQALGLTGRQPLFCTLDGRPLKSSYVRTLLPWLARKCRDREAGTPARPPSHARRRARWEGKPVNLIQAQLGHASLATTDRYLRHIAPRELVEAMRDLEWTL